MNLFKKFTATLALVTLLSGMFSVGANASSETEIEAANALAVKGYIVDHSDDSTAYLLNANVLRQEIAAVARGIAGLEKKTTCDNSFSDVSETTPNTWACYTVEALLDAGLIAANTKFNPELNITKAEAIGMMVKATFGNEYAYDSTLTTTWMEQVVDFAVSKGIVANFTNYNTPATRGFVFEAGYNAEMASTEVVEDCDEVSQLLGLCDDVVVVDEEPTTDENGDVVVVVNPDAILEVSTNPNSLADGTQIPNVGTVRFAKIDFTAGSEDVAVNTVEISKTTLASIPTGTRIWFELNGKRVSGQAAFSSENVAIVSFAPAYNVKAGETATLDLYVSLDTLAGNDFQFTGEVTDASVPSEGTFTTSLLTTANYTVAPSVVTITGSDTSYTDLATPVELAKFTVKNKDASSETRDVEFNSITLRQTGDADLSNVSDFTIERLGETVSTSATVDGKYITFTLNDVVKDSNTVTYYVKGLVNVVDNTNGDTYKFEIKKDTDVSIVEIANGFRSTVTLGGTLHTYTANGTDVTFARDTSTDLSQNVAIGTNGVTLLKGTLKTTTAITLEDAVLGFTTGLPGGTGANLIFNNIYLKIGSTVMTYTPELSDTGATFLGLATLQAGTTNVEIYADIKDSVSATSFSFDDLKLSSFVTAEYAVTQNAINSSVGSIAGVNLAIDSTILTANKVDGLGNTTLAAGSKNVLLNSVDLTVSQGNDVQISNPVYTVTYSGSALNNVFLTLYVDGVAKQTKTVNVISGGDVTFSSLSTTIGSTPTTLTIKGDFSDTFSAGDFSVKLTGIDGSDTLTSAPILLGSVANSAVLTLATAEGVLSSSDSTPKSQLLLAGSTSQKLLAFRVTAQNDTIKLRDLAFTGTNLSALNNFKITDVSGNTVVSNATTTSATGVTFTNLNLADSIAQDSTKTYYLVADVNLNTSIAGVEVSLDQANTKIKSSNGTITTATPSLSAIVSNTHQVENNMAFVAKDSNVSKTVDLSALRFSVTATGKNQATLSGATITANLSGYTGATTIEVYKDTISSTNLLGSATYVNNVATVISFSNLKTVDSGLTNHYIVRVNGALIDGNSTGAWTVSLNDLSVDLGGAAPVSALQFTNMGEFPITETK